MENITEPKWYQKPTGVTIILVIFFPAGLYLMWKNDIWSKTTRWIVTIIIALAIIANAGTKNISNNSGDSSKANDINKIDITVNDIPGIYNNFELNYQFRLKSDGSLEFYTATSMTPQIGYWKLNNNKITIGIPSWITDELVFSVIKQGLVNDQGKLVWKKV
jgi:hypothetical protein